MKPPHQPELLSHLHPPIPLRPAQPKPPPNLIQARPTQPVQPPHDLQVPLRQTRPLSPPRLTSLACPHTSLDAPPSSQSTPVPNHQPPAEPQPTPVTSHRGGGGVGCGGALLSAAGGTCLRMRYPHSRPAEQQLYRLVPERQRDELMIDRSMTRRLSHREWKKSQVDRFEAPTPPTRHTRTWESSTDFRDTCAMRDCTRSSNGSRWAPPRMSSSGGPETFTWRQPVSASEC